MSTPDGNFGEEQLVIATADNQKLKIIPWEKGWVSLPGWLDEQRLIINMAGNDSDESTRRKAATLLMLNPFTGERQILRPDFPNIRAEYPVFDWEEWGQTVYDPTLTRVVYPGPGYVLWDLEASQALATFLQFPIYPPHWSPDGARFVVAAASGFPSSPNYELYSLSRDGKIIEPLTNLHAYYPAVDMWGYSWSPSGSHLAFWLNTDHKAIGGDNPATQRLAVLDLTTQEVTDYCIPRDEYKEESFVGALPFPSSIAGSPIWSPDGRQLLIESRYAQYASRVILVDIIQEAAFLIADTMIPVGWLKSPP